MQLLRLNDLSVLMTLGVYAWEKRISRIIRVDLEIKSSSIVDYDDLILLIRSICKKKQFDYIEEASEEILSCLLNTFDPISLMLTVSKPSLMLSLESACVSLCYSRDQE